MPCSMTLHLKKDNHDTFQDLKQLTMQLEIFKNALIRIRNQLEYFYSQVHCLAQVAFVS